MTQEQAGQVLEVLTRIACALEAVAWPAKLSGSSWPSEVSSRMAAWPARRMETLDRQTEVAP